MYRKYLKETVDEDKGIFSLELQSFDDARVFIKELKKEYPYAVLNGTGYKSKTFILHLYEHWGDFLTDEIAEDGKRFKCCNCNDGLCNNHKKQPSWNSSPGVDNATERCFGEQFWAEVYEARERHFVHPDGDVWSFTKGEGGFCGRRYNIKLEDGTVLTNMGCWHRGKLPHNLEGHIQKGELI